MFWNTMQVFNDLYIFGLQINLEICGFTLIEHHVPSFPNLKRKQKLDIILWGLYIDNLELKLEKSWSKLNYINKFTINIYVFLSVHTFILFIKYTLTYHLWREKILDKALVVFWSDPWTKKQTFAKYMVVDGYKLTVLV